MNPVLRVEGLHKRFGGIVVSDNIHLTIGAGEILGLIGPNGAGKTSLFNLISGVLRPDAGTILLNGTPIDAAPLYGRAVCVVEHNVSFIRDLCSRAVFMANGKILQDGTVDELIGSAALTELYFGV